MRIPNLEGIIYDLDGVVISTVPLHNSARQSAASEMGIALPEGFLEYQKGLPLRDSARLLLENDLEKVEEFVTRSKRYVNEHIDEILIFEGFFETLQVLQEKKKSVWVCTSASRAFLEQVLLHEPRLNELSNYIVYREMYVAGKPRPDGLLLTFEKMGLLPAQCVYIGDAVTDYLAAESAHTNFIYFHPEMVTEAKIPSNVLRIKKHEELLNLVF